MHGKAERSGVLRTLRYRVGIRLCHNDITSIVCTTTVVVISLSVYFFALKNEGETALDREQGRAFRRMAGAGFPTDAPIRAIYS